MTTNNFPNIGYRNHGRDYNFFQKIIVSETTFGGNSVDGYQPNIIIPSNVFGAIFNIEGSGSNIVEYSFSGNFVHGELAQGTNRATLTFENRPMSTVWFRIKSGSSGPLTVSVEAWGVR